MRENLKNFKLLPVHLMVLELGYMVINTHFYERVFMNNFRKAFKNKFNTDPDNDLFTKKGVWYSICSHYFDGYILPTNSTIEDKNKKFESDFNNYVKRGAV